MSADTEKTIFLAALDCRSAAERSAYLAEACGSDPALRSAVDALLSAHDQSDGLLAADDRPAHRLSRQLALAARDLNLAAHDSNPATRPDRVGEQIGPYRLMEKLGEGGFGEVYVADQQQPIRRRVALKLLKPGMASRDVIARFEAERQALALMDHSHISRVFDAGATQTGQPYFVMELVRGVPITEFCERHQLTIPKRLELFVDVCQAVQHAHQKGVIHRDLKPSNVLVTLHDATPVVKVIDFGVAKAMGDPLTEKTVYTRLAQMIGTPMYMSPEQAEMNALDVDTRSDIYSLGVLLYELVTGATPFDQQRLQSAGFDELRRIIREEEPPRPSARLTTLVQASTLSSSRRGDSRTAANLLRGDLDWIVMKSLEKERRRRYDTAADLARDVERYLDQQPVLARPPSPWYRLRKLAQRNKVLFTTGSLVLVALVLGTAVSTWQAIEATQARAEADKLRNDALDFANRLKEANVLLDSARANADEQRWSTAAAQYTRATELQPEHYLTWSGRGSLYARVGAWHAAADDFATALELGAPANNPGWWGVPQLCLYAGNQHAYELASQRLRAQLAETDDPSAVSIAVRSLCLVTRNPEDARQLSARMEQILEQSESVLQDQPRSPDFRPNDSGNPPPRPRPEQPPGPMDQHPRPFGPPLEFQWYAAGLAQLRAGGSARAVERLEQVVKSPWPFASTRAAWPALALAYQAQDRPADAERALAESQSAIDSWTDSLADGSLQDIQIPWFDFVECILLYEEAERVIRGSAAPRDARLAAFEQRAVDLLHGTDAPGN